jgi:hypothetical protein
VNERVERVLACFAPESGKLSLMYHINGIPTGEDFENCEIACAELIAEFSEIVEAETQCRPYDGCSSEDERDEVFSRSRKII